jgi:hypothetical protein
VGAVLGLIEERVLAVENRFLQCSLAKVIIQWGPRLAQKQRVAGELLFRQPQGM